MARDRKTIGRAAARLSAAEHFFGIRPDVGKRYHDAAYDHELDLPDVETVRLRGTGRRAICEIGLVGHGNVVMPLRDAFRYRKFHAHCMEQLFVAFGRTERGEWNYRLFRARCETVRRDSEQAE
ncbi:hypothetical protein [Mesorhizobium sp. M0800]|uniref:hypothetical protein n=1 Tax=Mesorhizobium sp. M0800 TaxID=2957000 RepID=UPI00333A0092